MLLKNRFNDAYELFILLIIAWISKCMISINAVDIVIRNNYSLK